MQVRPFVLLDRDGTINVDKSYLSDPDQLELLPGAAEGLRQLQAAGCGLVVVTNQSGVGRGWFSLDDVRRVHERLRDLLRAEGVTLDGVYICPHVADDGCHCRKPRPGLVEQAVAEWRFDPRASFVVGDKRSDVELGHAVGAASLLVRTGYGATVEHEPALPTCTVVDDLRAAAQWITGRRSPHPGTAGR